MSETPEEQRMPMWLVSAMDQRIATLKEHGPPPEQVMQLDVLIMPLTDPVMDSTASVVRWEHTCDNCGEFKFNGLIGAVVEASSTDVDTKIVVSVDACPECWELP